MVSLMVNNRYLIVNLCSDIFIMKLEFYMGSIKPNCCCMRDELILLYGIEIDIYGSTSNRWWIFINSWSHGYSIIDD